MMIRDDLVVSKREKKGERERERKNKEETNKAATDDKNTLKVKEKRTHS
jgi:hypothetical protein